ncbi:MULTISPECIES: GNAT family N-acetyltransferase [unclassified Streptomyces]|uniref:GNAT family N-acetyltransferase n=1 Tax=unclassified Streptomyces TaxID=2593676 RepID=UPI00081E7FC5|nr:MULTISPECIES: GNAT family N-acetyltransferase [unclassified Streptomyces]SCF48252.1 Protein N-acetyltransferase, RimJ/RimL family [Streptomyces sp. LcepLS]
MTAPAPADWPPAPTATARLVLRASEARDRAAFVALFSSEEVGTYKGGARPRAELEAAMPAVPGQRPGFFVVTAEDEMIGAVTLDRREDGATELGYLFLPRVWGRGYATEACAAALGWCAAERPGEPVVVTIQTANTRSMRLAARLGFTEVKRFHEWGAEQWRGELTRRVPAG